MPSSSASMQHTGEDRAPADGPAGRGPPTSRPRRGRRVRPGTSPADRPFQFRTRVVQPEMCDCGLTLAVGAAVANTRSLHSGCVVPTAGTHRGWGRFVRGAGQEMVFSHRGHRSCGFCGQPASSQVRRPSGVCSTGGGGRGTTSAVWGRSAAVHIASTGRLLLVPLGKAVIHGFPPACSQPVGNRVRRPVHRSVHRLWRSGAADDPMPDDAAVTR